MHLSINDKLQAKITILGVEPLTCGLTAGISAASVFESPCTHNRLEGIPCGLEVRFTGAHFEASREGRGKPSSHPPAPDLIGEIVACGPFGRTTLECSMQCAAGRQTTAVPIIHFPYEDVCNPIMVYVQRYVSIDGRVGGRIDDLGFSGHCYRSQANSGCGGRTGIDRQTLFQPIGQTDWPDPSPRVTTLLFSSHHSIPPAKVSSGSWYNFVDCSKTATVAAGEGPIHVPPRIHDRPRLGVVVSAVTAG